MRKKRHTVLEQVVVENYAAEGKSISRQDGKVVFIENVVPGDVVDVRLFKNKKDWAEGFPVHFHSYSSERVTPFCQHFQVCGGCQWQMLPYEKQLQYKQQQVFDNLSRIGHVELPPFPPIIGAAQDKFYRNKLEYTFSTKEYTVEKPAPSNSPKGGEQHRTNPNSQSHFYEHADPMMYGLLKDVVATLRKNQTVAEHVLWEQLRAGKLQGYKFRRQHIIGRFIADFVCLEKNLIIEVDGLIHQHPDHQLNDEERTDWLNKNGFEVLRFNNDDVLNNIQQVLSKIAENLDQLPNADLIGKPSAAVSPPLGEPEGALGFHAKGLFDKVVHIEKCWLQPEPTNDIRNAVREFARQKNYSFYDYREHRGLLRNMMVRICTTGEVMVNVVLGADDQDRRNELMEFIIHQFPQITTLLYTINTKMNDSIFDLEPVTVKGSGYVMEKLSTGTREYKFKIGPKSFFQTNTSQGEQLYRVAKEFAELDGSQTLYDLYCGTGSIGIFCSADAKKVIGVEAIAEAVNDARLNAELNGIDHAQFHAGDVIKVCTDDFFQQHGRPDVIITDPPRAGMHQTLVEKILAIEAPTVVYVSCNPATQARDLRLLDAKYAVTRVQPVDMFPHTHHIENVVQLKLR